MYKAGCVEIKNIGKMILGKSCMISCNLHERVILHRVGWIQVGKEGILDAKGAWYTYSASAGVFRDIVKSISRNRGKTVG